MPFNHKRSYQVYWLRTIEFLTELFTAGTVDVEGVVATLDAQVGEDLTVGAQLFGENVVGAFVVPIALLGVGEETVRFRTGVAILGAHFGTRNESGPKQRRSRLERQKKPCFAGR